MIQELIDAGLYSRDEAQVLMNKNLVTRALGIDPVVDVDVLETDVIAGDYYLLCSDGLSDMVGEQAMAAVLKEDISLDAMARRLVGAANDNGGLDNITVVLVHAGT